MRDGLARACIHQSSSAQQLGGLNAARSPDGRAYTMAPNGCRAGRSKSLIAMVKAVPPRMINKFIDRGPSLKASSRITEEKGDERPDRRP